MSDGKITYSAGILENLNDITRREAEFTGLIQEMEDLKKSLEGEEGWNPQSESAQAFYGAHGRWTNEVHEIQQVLRTIIARATDGVGDMASTEKSVASMFHG
ncbi:hypothetical protein [Williamsia sp.]|uniref:WXG100 family type VII secretion target n=1 Tax=Williamsia sp. TaxID=1872085 RepID=UPI001A278231|nr:hypothetical protein [Williamsia sp.]MBJ7290822.1 hypothetical protein [Williamsia sp.]